MVRRLKKNAITLILKLKTGNAVLLSSYTYSFSKIIYSKIIYLLYIKDYYIDIITKQVQYEELKQVLMYQVHIRRTLVFIAFNMLS